MPYGTLALDQITPSTNLKIVGGVQLNDNSVISTFNSMGMRNRIINGSMDIDQRNAGSSQTITAGAALAYTVDRWYAYCTGANVTAQRVANTGTAGSPSLYAYQFTGAASVTGIGFGQRIEAVNCYDLAGSTATLGVSLANSLLTTVTWTAYYANTIDTFGTLASPTRTQIATGTFTVNSQLTRYNAQITVPSAATTGIEIVFSVAAQTSGTWTIDNVQFEPGSVATPFERKMITHETNLCYRYYYRWSSNGATYAHLAVCRAYSTTNGTCNIFLPSPMRKYPPTLSTSTVSASTWDYSLTAINPSGTGVIPGGPGNLISSYSVNVTGSLGGAGTCFVLGSQNSTTPIFLALDAEL